MSSSTVNKKKVYEQKDEISHILDRSDMYVGSTKPQKCDEYIATDDFQIIKKSIIYAPAILEFLLKFCQMQ